MTESKIKSCVMAIGTVLIALVTTSLLAEPNSAARVQAMSKLPNWNGVWIATGTHKTLDPSGRSPPYNNEWRAKFAAERKVKHWSKQDSLLSTCVAGVPRLLGSPYPFAMMITPEEVLIHYAHREVRHVYTDGRDHPPVDELWPNAWGMSIGHWDDQTLIISTVSTKPDLWIDSTGATLSAQVEIIERISAINASHLKSEITISDPVSLSKPWKFTRYYRRTLKSDIEDEQCDFAAIKKAK